MYVCVCVYMCHREQYRGQADNQRQLSECLQTCCIECDVHEEVQVMRRCGGGGGGGVQSANQFMNSLQLYSVQPV